MKAASAKPLVTGIAPREGKPGITVTIRGDNLGQNQADVLGVFICGVDCSTTAQWINNRKITARCGPTRGPQSGEIIVVTRSGGKGSSTVPFRVVFVQPGIFEESAVWCDETRTMPTRQHGATVSTVYVRDDNPLGLSEDRQAQPLTNLSDFFPDGSGNLKLENFIPAWYLLECHQSASYDDLRAGLDNLKRQKQHLTHGPQDFVKSNLPAFIGCLDALTNLQEKVQDDRITSNAADNIERLAAMLRECKTKADDVFSEVLGRKDRADATRNALAILQRFKFLFYLPRSIDASILKGDYAMVLNDYTRAKSLFADTEVPLFKEAFVEVEKKMQSFKRVLKEKLVEMPSSLDEQKNIIRYLQLLEPTADHAWTCLTAYHRWLLGLLWDNQQKSLAQAKEDFAAAERDLPMDDGDRIVSDLPQHFHFVDSVCGVLTNRLLQFWKLAQLYLTTSFIPSLPAGRDDEVEKMVGSIFRLASWLIMNAVLPDALPAEASQQYKDRLAKWPQDERDDTLHLLQALKSIRLSLTGLLQQEFKQKHMQPLYDLSVTIRLRCLSRIVEQTIESVVALEQRENWKLLATGTDFSRTQLPDLFESMVIEVAPLLRQILSVNVRNEVDLFADERLRQSIVGSMQRLLCSFKDSLEVLSKLTDAPALRPTKLSLVNAAVIQRPASGGGKDAQRGIKDKRLLVVLSNCDYCKKHSLPKLADRLRQIGVKGIDDMLQSTRAYNHLNALLMKAYVAAKCSPFPDLLSTANYMSVKECAKVSDYIKDLVLRVVSVRAELFLLSPHFIPVITVEVVRQCCQQLATRMEALRFEDAGRTQAYADLIAFEESLLAFLDTENKNLLQGAKKSLMAGGSVDTGVATRAVSAYNDTMKLLLVSMKAEQSRSG